MNQTEESAIFLDIPKAVWGAGLGCLGECLDILREAVLKAGY